MCSSVEMPPAIGPVAVVRLLALCLRFRWEAQAASPFACSTSHNRNSSTASTLLVEYQWNGDYHGA
ncbi:MAG: hypothetical protein M3Y81_06595 [Chloroflexota bacterium]|nr:hypothetical protein [Chloroflexota bacterium]